MEVWNKIKDMLFMTRRGLLFLILLFSFLIYKAYKRYINPDDIRSTEFMVPGSNVFVFPNTTGPEEASTIAPPQQRTSWRAFSQQNDAAMALLLTDTTSCWLGLVQGLSNIGIPFTITTNALDAVKHKVVLVYPVISGKVLNADALRALIALPGNGGTLIATNIYGGGMTEVFGYKDITPASNRTKFKLNSNTTMAAVSEIMADMTDKEIVLAGKDIPGNLGTVGYNGTATPIIDFEDGSACMIYKDHGTGKAYAIGIDLGNFFQRYMNGRGFDPDRAYVNAYDASIDVLLRIIRQIYVVNEPNAVTVSPVAYGKPFTLTITHDIDFTRSIVNAAAYADMEKQHGVKATYFIQTKYIKDWNDDIFFNTDNIKYLQHIRDNGMEIGSHSVAHSKTFSKFPLGTGKEQYPGYKPFVKDRFLTYNGTILGELRTSKFLLEHFAEGVTVHSFRPGHLQYPFALPQCLEATGYRNSTSVTSGTVQTNFPYMLMYNREYDALTDVVEIPVAVEDEAGLPMLQRFDSTVLLATKLARYGGVLNVLIHTDILGQKYEYEQKLIERYKDTAWVSTVDELGNWWRARRNIKMNTTHLGKTPRVSITCNGSVIDGITLQVPATWHLGTGIPGVHQEGRNVIIDHLSASLDLHFKEN